MVSLVSRFMVRLSSPKANSRAFAHVGAKIAALLFCHLLGFAHIARVAVSVATLLTVANVFDICDMVAKCAPCCVLCCGVHGVSPLRLQVVDVLNSNPLGQGVNTLCENIF